MTQAPELVLRGNTGDTLVINGVTIHMTHSIGPTPTRVDTLHPAPSGQRWEYFTSQVLTSTAGSNSTAISYDYHLLNGTDCSYLGSATVGFWGMDDRDRRYGSTVHELFVVYALGPSLSQWGMIALALILLSGGVIVVRRRAQPWT
jgi:hypothetical protein